jgi:predicted amidohydrolase YtcJ
VRALFRSGCIRIGTAAAALVATLSLPGASTVQAAARTSDRAASADKIYVNGKFWMGRGGDSYAEAIALSGEHIIATGTAAEVSSLRTPQTRVIDLGGAFVVPGFIDNHVHFISGGIALQQADLRDARTPAEFTRRIAAAAKARPGKWITDGNWDHQLWGGALPTRDWIDGATPTSPVFVSRLDGHMALANSLTLKLAGISAATPDPEGGLIVRDKDGKPTGILKDRALDLVTRIMPAPSDSDMDEAFAKAADYALRRGVTQIHDLGIGEGEWRSLETYRRALAGKHLRLRIYSFVPLADSQRLAAYVKANGRGSDWLRWGGLKGFVDGSLGSGTAWFHAPYTDAPGTTGLTILEPDLLYKRIDAADRAGLHVAVHAIGDRANDWLLDAYARIEAANGPRDRRFRIEHAQHLTPAAIGKFRLLGVIASMQPYHAIDDGRWAERRIGAERLKGTYAFRSLLDAGAHVTFGSDWPVAPIDPLIGIYAAVTRRTIDGANPGGWRPEQKISVAEALRAYTSENAYAGYQETSLGMLAPGYLADFVVLSRNLFEVDPVDIPTIKVLRTVIGGRDEFVGTP